MLECFIPVYPKAGNEFLIYRWKSGYFPKGSGPRIAFMHREKDECVTLLEIEKTIKILDIPQEIFWHYADGCMVDPEKGDAIEQPRRDSPSDD